MSAVMIITVAIGVVFLYYAREAYAFPGGAPSQACSTLTPSHSSFQPQISNNPYKIDLSVFDDGNGTYQPGNSYQCKSMCKSLQYCIVVCILKYLWSKCSLVTCSIASRCHCDLHGGHESRSCFSDMMQCSFNIKMVAPLSGASSSRPGSWLLITHKLEHSATLQPTQDLARALLLT